jgi:hypothetical protein
MSGNEGILSLGSVFYCPRPFGVVGPDSLKPNSDSDLVLIIDEVPDLKSLKMLKMLQMQKIVGLEKFCIFVWPSCRTQKLQK